MGEEIDKKTEIPVPGDLLVGEKIDGPVVGVKEHVAQVGRLDPVVFSSHVDGQDVYVELSCQLKCAENVGLHVLLGGPFGQELKTFGAGLDFPFEVKILQFQQIIAIATNHCNCNKLL